jgi:hypothetical protein
LFNFVVELRKMGRGSGLHTMNDSSISYSRYPGRQVRDFRQTSVKIQYQLLR